MTKIPGSPLLHNFNVHVQERGGLGMRLVFGFSVAASLDTRPSLSSHAAWVRGYVAACCNCSLFPLQKEWWTSSSTCR